MVFYMDCVLKLLLMLPFWAVTQTFWFPRYGIVYLLLLCLPGRQAFLMSHTEDDNETPAEILPSSLMDGYVNETDGQFTIQCRILDNYYENSDLTPEKINSSSLYWTYNRTVLDDAYIVDERTLGVTVQNITTLMSGKYRCKMNESAIGGKSDKSMVTTEITIGNPPEPVTSIKCVSLNWMEMVCYWCQSKPRDPLTKYTMHYQIDSTQGGVECPHYVTGPCCGDTDYCGCHWQRSDEDSTFKQGQVYILSLNVTSKYLYKGHLIYTDVVETGEPYTIVKPGPVEDLTVVAINSTALNITWKPNEHMDSIDYFNQSLYVVHYKSEWEEDADEEQTVNVDINKSLILTNLRPYTRYDIAVRSKTKASENISLYWSDWVNETQRTQISNPNIGPPMSASSYKWLDCIGESNSMLQLFWQEIPEIDRNGEIKVYKIELKDIKSDITQVKLVAGSEFSNGRFLDCLNSWGRSYRVEIEAQTAPHLPSPPTVLHIESNLTIPKNIYAEVDADTETVALFFDFNGTADNFTLLRCMPDQFDPTFCETSPVMHIIAGDQRQTEVDNWESGEVFAIGASRDQYSSGLTKDWIPLCRKGKIPGQPEISVHVEAERSLTVTWDRVECSNTELLGMPSEYEIHWTDGKENDSALIPQREEQYRHVIEDLKPATLYNVSVVARSSAGYSQSDTQSHTTKYSAPGDPPQNVTVQDIGADYLTIQCDPPTQPNGEIHQYHVFISGGSQVNVTKAYPAGEMHEGVNVTDLDGYTNYSVSLQADNMQGGEGGLSDMSTPLYFFTNIGQPSEVDDLHITFKDKTTVNVAWAPPNPPNGPLEHMWYRIEGQLGDKPFSNESRSTLVDLSFNKDCGTDSEEVMVRVTALMKEDPQNVLKGQPSNTVKETICGLTNIPLIVGVCFGGVVVLLIFGLALVKGLHYCQKKNDEAEDKARVVTDDLMDKKIETVTESQETSRPADMDSATGTDEGDLYLSSQSSNTSEDSGDSLLCHSQQHSGQPEAPAEECHLSRSPQDHVNVLVEKSPDFNISPTDQMHTGSSEVSFVHSQESSALDYNRAGPPANRFYDDTEIPSNVPIMTSAPLTSGGSSGGKWPSNQQDLDSQNTASLMDDYAVADIPSANTASSAHSENPPIAFPAPIGLNPPSHSSLDAVNISSIPDSLTASSANEYAGYSENSESSRFSSSDSAYVGQLPSSSPQSSHQEEEDIEMSSAPSNTGFRIDPKILRLPPLNQGLSQDSVDETVT